MLNSIWCRFHIRYIHASQQISNGNECSFFRLHAKFIVRKYFNHDVIMTNVLLSVQKYYYLGSSVHVSFKKNVWSQYPIEIKIIAKWTSLNVCFKQHSWPIIWTQYSIASFHGRMILAGTAVLNFDDKLRQLKEISCINYSHWNELWHLNYQYT